MVLLAVFNANSVIPSPLMESVRKHLVSTDVISVPRITNAIDVLNIIPLQITFAQKQHD